MIILLHTSKTMRMVRDHGTSVHSPVLMQAATELAEYAHTLTQVQLMSAMHVSATLAETVAKKYAEWTSDLQHQSPAIDSFIGDIYSGLRADRLNQADREYADRHLRILSGLYGILRPLDGVMPYRLEMGYKLPDRPYQNLYKFWGDSVAETLPQDETIINLAAVEYSRLVIPFVDASRVITPRFLTVHEKTREPVFVVVHAKIARGAFARWMITSRVASVDRLREFNDIGYRYDPEQSTEREPVFICEAFGGIGLSMRLEVKS